LEGKQACYTSSLCKDLQLQLASQWSQQKTTITDAYMVFVATNYYYYYLLCKGSKNRTWYNKNTKTV